VPLSAEDKRAEEARVNREIAANQKKAVIPFVGLAGGMSLSPGEHRWADTVQGSIVKTSIFTNERRVMYRERPAIQIEFTGNPCVFGKAALSRILGLFPGGFAATTSG